MNNPARYGVILATTLTLFACNSDSDNILDDLNANRAKWESANIDTYQFDYSISCFCLDDVTRPRLVVVNANQVESQTIIENNTALSLDNVDSETVATLFDRIALEESRAESLTVSYHPQLGYPTRIQVDGNAQTADDEYTIEVSNVVAEDDIACTASVESGLIVSVTDQITEEPIACNATVTATEEDFNETAMGTCGESEAITMLDERPGFYSITIEKAGYQTFQVNDYGIGKDLCHVLPRELNVELIPE
ncbi:DUF6174 domain-containing protein [Alteromonas sp. A079]|uniref:DUF6174 domain-containing protein n=1 Tax=Alteromonas sp. A079 TaxID=3410268 RepID=UPI003B9F5EEC